MKRTDRERPYISSRECRKCHRDYLWPAYGSDTNVCNDCIITYGRSGRS